MPQIHASAEIHAGAIIAPGAIIGAGCRIGPFCTVGPQAVLGENVELVSHVVIDGATRLGDGVRVLPFACVGTAPQDLKYKNEPTGCEIGDRTLIREGVTIHRGSVGGDGMTRIGSDCMLMAMSHVGHDCVLGNNVILANNVMLGGHVRVGDTVFVGGGAAVHQTVRIGRQAMIGGLAGVTNDVPPFGNVFGLPARLVGLNAVGLRRRGFNRSNMHALRAAFRLMFGEPGVFADRVAQARERWPDDVLVQEVIAFVSDPARRRELVRPSRMATAVLGAEDEENGEG